MLRLKNVSKFAVKLVAIGVAAVMLVGCAGVRLANRDDVIARSLQFVSHSGAVIPDSVLYPEGIRFQTPQHRGTLQNIMIERDVVRAIENDYWEMVISNVGLEAYFICRRTGHIHPTNPVFFDFPDQQMRQDLFGTLGGFTEMQRTLYSQLNIVYYDSDGRATHISSFPDAVSPQRFQVSTERGERRRYDENGNYRYNPTFTVHYTIGVCFEDFGLMIAMSPEKYNDIYNRLMALVHDRVISLPEMRVFPNLHTGLTWQDMVDGRVGFDPDEYIIRYPMLPYLGKVYMLKPFSQRQYNDLLRLYDLIGITPEEIEEQFEFMGRPTMGVGTANFRIPLVYELDGNSILMYIDTSRIVSSEGYTLHRIDINRTFGASRPTDSGYIFVPDGSGSIIKNNEPVRALSTITIPFFGTDWGKCIWYADQVTLSSVFPVFGSRRGWYAMEAGVQTYRGSVGMFAIVEQGAAIGGVTAEIAANPDFAPGEGRSTFGGALPYNRVFPYLIFHDYDEVSIVGFGAIGQMFAQNPNITEFTVRYNFLYDDWASYVGFARFYQKYLERTGVLTESAPDTPLPLDINLMGSILRTVNVFGVPVRRDYPVTTFDQAQTIMGMLRDGGIDNANLIFSGAINGGMDWRAPNAATFQRELGGQRAFNNLYAELRQMDFTLSTHVDFMRVFRAGNGVRPGMSRHDTIREVNQMSAHITDFWPAARTATQWDWALLINPLIMPTMARNFHNDFTNVDSRSLYLSSFGEILYSNFHEDMELSRIHTETIVRDVLAFFQEEGYEIVLGTGNSYVLEFADRLINVPTSSSNQRLESHSIPFVGMVLKGFIPFSGEPLNRSGNVHRSLLEAVESGAGLQYTLMYANQLTLMETRYMNMFSVNYGIWMEDIIDTFTRLNNEMGPLANVRITNHERLGTIGTPGFDVVRVTYENGWLVYVNYGREYWNATGGGVVAPLDYLVVRR